MSVSKLILCRRPEGAHWQLGPLPAAGCDVALLRWEMNIEPVDGGVPTAVADLLAKTMIALGRVTFPITGTGRSVPTSWSELDGDWICAFPGAGLGWIRDKLNRLPDPLVLVSTVRAPAALQLFDDGSFSWSMGTQFVFLSARDALPPTLSRRVIIGMLEDDWATTALSLRSAGIHGVCRAGVDGDVAGFLPLSDEFGEIFIAELEAQARLAQLDFVIE